MSKIQLYMCGGNRKIILERHRFYVAEVQRRLLSQFADIEAEAERFEEEAWEQAMQSPSFGDDDLSAAAEWARDEGIGHYMMLDDLRKQVFLGGIAGMFHQWDKDLREFIDLELLHYIEAEWIDKNVWRASTADIFDMLEQFDWKVRSRPFYPIMDACGLIVNVHKHGKGPSLDRLAKEYPEYLSRTGRDLRFGRMFLDHRWLEASSNHFDLFAQAIESFWTEMPERSYFARDS